MRKHRLAERLLTDVIGLDWELAHTEACRWEHVISDEVETRLVEVLGDPATSPFGNPIPAGDAAQTWTDLVTTRQAAGTQTTGTIARISERLQVDVDAMRALRVQGVTPGAMAACSLEGDRIRLDIGGTAVLLDRGTADMVWIDAA